ncbi:unnamed protein product, partial [Amoebophrya sp. A25]
MDCVLVAGGVYWVLCVPAKMIKVAMKINDGTTETQEWDWRQQGHSLDFRLLCLGFAVVFCVTSFLQIYVSG